jgi:hypothetical protein
VKLFFFLANIQGFKERENEMDGWMDGDRVRRLKVISFYKLYFPSDSTISRELKKCDGWQPIIRPSLG